MRFNDFCNHINGHLVNTIDYRDNPSGYDGYQDNNDMRTQHNQPQFNGTDNNYQQPNNEPPYQQNPQRPNPRNYNRPPKKHHWVLDTLGVLMVVVIGITMWGAHENNQAAQQAQQNARQAQRTEKPIQKPKPQSQQLAPSSNPQDPSADIKSLEQEMQNFQIENNIQQALINAYQNQKPAKQIKIYEDVQKPLRAVPSFARPFMARHVANAVVNHYAQNR